DSEEVALCPKSRVRLNRARTRLRNVSSLVLGRIPLPIGDNNNSKGVRAAPIERSFVDGTPRWRSIPSPLRTDLTAIEKLASLPRPANAGLSNRDDLGNLMSAPPRNWFRNTRNSS